MAKYWSKKYGEALEVYQLDFGQFPAWIMKAVDEGRIVLWPKDENCLKIKYTSYSYVKVYFGDYVVLLRDGVIKGHSKATFKAEYEEIPEGWKKPDQSVLEGLRHVRQKFYDMAADAADVIEKLEGELWAEKNKVAKLEADLKEAKSCIASARWDLAGRTVTDLGAESAARTLEAYCRKQREKDVPPDMLPSRLKECTVTTNAPGSPVFITTTIEIDGRLGLGRVLEEYTRQTDEAGEKLEKFYKRTQMKEENK